MDGFDLRGPERTINELGGAIVAHPDRPHTLYACVGMGDGGGRVVYEPDGQMPPTETPADHKELEQAMVPDTGEPGRAWVTLDAPDFVPLGLPPLELTVTLTVTATHGDITRESRLVTRHTVTVSAWALLWSTFDAMNFDDTDEDGVIDTPKPFQLCQLTLELSRYRLTFDATDAGVPDVLQIDYLPDHDMALAFRGTGGQGEIECPAGLGFSSSRVVVGGDLGPVIRVRAVSGRLHLSRRFTPGVLTSEVRVRRGDVELIREGADMLPNALSCKPFREPSHEVVAVTADVVLTDLARGTTWLVAALAALGLAVIVLALLIPFLFALMPVVAVALLVSGGRSAVVGALVAAGLAWVVTDLVAPLVLRRFAEDQLRASLGSAATGRQLAASGLLSGAGEGLAESIARWAIREACEEHDIEPPGDEGRDRFRPQVFETIVVTEGRARVKLRVSFPGS